MIEVYACQLVLAAVKSYHKFSVIKLKKKKKMYHLISEAKSLKLQPQDQTRGIIKFLWRLSDRILFLLLPVFRGCCSPWLVAHHSSLPAGSLGLLLCISFSCLLLTRTSVPPIHITQLSHQDKLSLRCPQNFQILGWMEGNHKAFKGEVRS